MTIPPEYAGREQTLLKHLVLTEYIQGWAHKRGSRAKFERTKLWYVDCFAGPWNALGQELGDTSVSIGLKTLRDAATTWEEKGLHVELGAIFVEKDPKSFEVLRAYLDEHREGIEVVAFPGEFGDHVAEINRRIGRDPAFLFVDPTGWKGAAMRFIEPLASPDDRDVLINVMFNHINRFKDDPRAFLREQIGDFFGLEPGAIPPGLSEDALFDLYREQLRDKCRLPFVADLAIPHPTQERTWFRLVVGGHHSAIVDLFRKVERRVCGEAAGAIRQEAKQRGEQQLLLGGIGSAPEQSYQRLHRDGLREASGDVLRLLAERSPRLYSDLWPHVLSERHIAKPDLNKIVWELHKKKALTIRGLTARHARRTTTVSSTCHRSAADHRKREPAGLAPSGASPDPDGLGEDPIPQARLDGLAHHQVDVAPEDRHEPHLDSSEVEEPKGLSNSTRVKKRTPRWTGALTGAG